MPIKRICIALVVLLLGCKESPPPPSDEWQKAPVPVIKPGATIQLRVVTANNPRLPRFSPEYMRIMLASAQLAVWKDFGVNVEFSEAPEMGVEQLFKIIPPQVKEARMQAIYDFKSGSGDKHRLAASIKATLADHGTKLNDALAFIRDDLPEAHPKDMTELSELLATVMLERLEQWRHIKAADGAPVLDASPYNEWIYWDTLGYGELPYDLVITNQFIASAEYDGVDIHSALRGGVTTGTTSYSRTGKFHSYVFMSTFSFLDDSDLTKQMRGGEQYSEASAAELAGAYMAHEIGHLLFQLGHPFGQKACAMNPARMLRFREWFNQVNGNECRIGSRTEMKVGNIPQYFNPAWVRMSRKP